MTRGKIRVKVGRRIKRLKGYIGKNLGAPLILTFMALLLTSAIFLLLDMSEASESLAVAAYFILIAGVLLQLVSYFLESRRHERANE